MRSFDRSLPERWVAVVVGALAFALYLPALGNGFAYDDVPLIPGDPRIHSFEGLGAILFRPYWVGAGEELALYRPLTTLSFALDWMVSGGAPAWFHFTNVLWHVVVCVLAVLLLCRIFGAVAALAGGALFAVHPVHVEAVANVVGRSELIAAALFLAACLIWDRRSGDHPTMRVVIAITALFFLALMAKESAVMLPASLLLLDFARGRLRLVHGGGAEYTRRNLPAFITLSIALCIYIGLRMRALGGFATPALHPAAEAVDGRLDLLMMAFQAWPEYVRLLFFPKTLLIDYGPQVIRPADGGAAALGALVLLGLFTWAMIAVVRGRSGLVIALAWFPITILPVSNLIIPVGVLVAERTLYLPSLAISLGVAATMETVLLRERSILWPRVTALAVTVAVLFLGVRSLQRIPEWESTERIFAALVRDRPDSYRGHWYMGRVAREAGDYHAAVAHFQEAVRLWPHRERLVIDAAATAAQAGMLVEARSVAEIAARHWPENIDAQRILAGVSLDLGDPTTARAAVQAGLRVAPDDAVLRKMQAHLATLSGTR